MKKVFIIHGLEGEPNGAWRPWLMGELAKKEIYAAALAMPNPDHPQMSEWIEEIRRHVKNEDDVYLIGHSLGVPAIFRYLEIANTTIKGAVLISGPFHPTGNDKINNFFETPFDFPTIKSKIGNVTLIHGDDDPLVPLTDAEELQSELGGELIVVQGGKHLNGSAGWLELPQALDAITSMV